MRPNLRSSLGFSLVLLTLPFLAACGSDGGGNGTTDPPTTGALRATVTVDAAPASGVTVRLYPSGGAAPDATQTTGNDGTTTFSNLTPGARDVEVVPPTDAVVPAGEQQRKAASVTAGQTSQLSFALASDIGEVVEILVQDNLTFSPAELTIEAGTTVRWRSTSSMLHTVTPEGHTAWSSASLGGVGETFTFTFDEPGSYAYFCEPHLAAGMTGTVIVQ
jgi:plastocyanin